MATLQMKIDHVHAEFVSGNAVSSTVSTHSVVSRDGSGNVHANKFKSANMELTHNVPTSARTSDTVFYSSVDDVIRKNTAAGIKTSLGLNNVNNTGATTAATANKIVLRDSYGDIFASNVDVSHNFKMNGTALANSATIGAVKDAGTANKIAQRNASGDIHTRLFRSTYQNQSTISGGIAYRVSTTDNYIRFCNDKGSIRSFLDVPTRSGGNASGSWGIDITGNAATASSCSGNAATASSCSGNAATATNADTVDSLHASSFLRSDADDTVGAGVTYTWSATNTHGLKFVNASYSAYSLEIGGWTSSNNNNISRIRNSTGNLHIDSAANGNLYLNHYSGGTCYITTNTYNSGTLESDGRIYADNGCHVRGDWLRVNGNTGVYWESHGGGWYMQDTTWVRVYNGKSLWCANGIMATDYRCGVGTSNPSVPLHVYGTGASLNWGNYRYMSVSGSSSGGNTWGALCASFEGGHVRSTDSFLAHNGSLNTSDERIKKEISDINDASALETLRLIQPKTYKYIDEEKMGSDVVYGFIAQQVREVLPYATKTLTEYLPSIREMINVTQSNVVTFTNFNTNDLLSNTTIIQAQLFKGENKDLTISEIIDEHSIRVEEDLTEMLHEDETRLYIYGELVDDFLFLKKESIFTVATAALQEVDRQLQSEKAKVATLETQLTSVLARLDALENA